MKHRYIIIDGEYGGTGVRDQFEGPIDLSEIPISDALRNKITAWVRKYPSAGSGIEVQNTTGLFEYDQEGIEIMNMASKELGTEYKVRYFSDLKTKELKEIEGGKTIEL